MKRSPQVLVLTLWILGSTSLMVPAQAEGAALIPVNTDHIVNGVTTTDYPSTVALVDPDNGRQICTGTLIGCQTVLTAAHCVCETDGARCQSAGADLLAPAQVQVFFQHQGLAEVASISVHPDYVFGIDSDVAVLKLSEPVNGIAPTPINDQLNPSVGTPGSIVGFGLTHGNNDDAGLKRRGEVVTAACSAVPATPHLCWRFSAPLGDPGTDSNTCSGDSGGPLFMDFGAGRVVAGVTSGGANATCQTVDEAWDANVFYNRLWIADQTGADLDNTSCGNLPQAGEADAPTFSVENTLSTTTPQRFFSLEIPPSTARLRVTLNSEEGRSTSPNDFDLFLRAGDMPSTSTFDCGSQLAGSYEVCDIEAPQAGTWNVLADQFTGQGNFQVTATVFADDGTITTACVPSPTTLCIDDQPGDRRFAISVGYQTALGGGSSGQGQSIPLSSLGIRRGGLFWFFDITNPELLIKVLNGCNVNGNYWVFWSAGTTVGLDLEVTDMATGRTATYPSPDGTTAQPITDTAAFSCG